jgi:hypothetical protein
MSSGFNDKLYWRQVEDIFHCFSASGREPPRFRSLCGEQARRQIGGGQHCARPIAVRRCARCDVLEMKRRGWSESGDPS